MIDFYRQITRTSRIHHLCKNCNWLIPPGAKYWISAGTFGDTFVSTKLCMDCHDLVDVVLELCEPEYGMVPIDSMFDELWNCGFLVDAGRGLPPAVAEECEGKLEVVIKGEYWRVKAECLQL